MSQAQMSQQRMVEAGRRLRRAGLAPGSSGNVSVRAGSVVLITPTKSRLGGLRGDELAVVRPDGSRLSGRPPSKEVSLHLGLYTARPEVRAIVHLHSPYCVAASCLADLDREDAFAPYTAYALMRLGNVAVVPFAPPGSAELAISVAAAAAGHHALLLANHGSLVGAESLEAACDAAEEMEQAAQTQLLLRGVEQASLVPEEFRDQLRDS